MTSSIKAGATLAAVAASLFLSGEALAGETARDSALDLKGYCIGANACKGQSACMTAKNACAGQNSCKGQGFVESTAAECSKIEGAKFEPGEPAK